MRRPLIVPTKGAEWRVSPFLIYDSNGNVVQAENACGPYEERRDVQCVVDDRPVGDSYCRDVGPKPEDSKQSFIDTGCSYDWFQGQWQDPGPSCSNAEAQERVVECRRSYDNVKVDDSLCSGSKPTTERTVVDHSTCTYSWNSSDPFADPGQNCTATEEWTRDVFCERDLDKVQVADGQCDAATKPTSIDVREDYSACSYSWDADETFLDPGASCTDSETQTRAVWCKRDLDGNIEDDAQCDPSTRPDASQTVEDFSGCSYSWDPQEWGSWDSQCSSNATRSRDVDCLRSDGTTTNDMAARCHEDAGDPPASSETQEVYDSCSYSWTPGAWQDPGASCSASETQSRSITCTSSDGRTVEDSFCTEARPSDTRTVEDYSSCSYAWVEGGFQDPGSSCTASETQTQTVTCLRSDGTRVPNSECDAATKPPMTQTVEDYSACSYDWLESGFSNWSSTCSASAKRTQTVTCRRSDGTTVSDSNCSSGSKPPTSQTKGIYSGCGYDWITGGWRDPGASCTPSETQTRTVSCRRSDGTTVDNSNCGSGKPSATRTVVDYSGCQVGSSLTVRWNGWSSWSSSCSTSATRTRSGTCLADGTAVASSVCTSRGLAVTDSERSAQYSGCSYTPTYASSWSACTNGSQNRAMTSCRRDQTGQSVSTSTCVNAGHAVRLVRSCNETPHCWYHDRFAYASHVPGSSTINIRYSIGSGVTGTPTGFVAGNYSGSISIPAGSNPSGRTTTINGVKFKVGSFARAAGTGGGRGGSGDPNADAYGICRSTP